MKEWKEFLDLGLLWFVNRQLHLVGWVLLLTEDKKGNVIDVTPQRTEYRGFSLELEQEGFEKFTKMIEKELSRIKTDVFG